MFVVVVLILAISFGLVIYFFSKHKTQNDSVLLTNQQAEVNLPVDQSGFGLPIQLKIPAIKVDATVSSVGLTSDGSVGVPQGPNDVAWFDLGPRPGSEGSSVIDGHSGWKDGIPAVFDNLGKLKKGDKLSIEDDKGKTINFVVRALRTYSPNDNATIVFNSNDGKAHLNLITCAGVWSQTDKSHSERLVVFADEE